MREAFREWESSLQEWALLHLHMGLERELRRQIGWLGPLSIELFFFPICFLMRSLLSWSLPSQLGWAVDGLPPQCWVTSTSWPAWLLYVGSENQTEVLGLAQQVLTLSYSPTPSPYTYFLSSICYTPDCEFENKIIILWIQNLNVLKLLIFNDFQVGSKCIRKRFKKSATELLTIQPSAIKMLLTFFPILPIIQVIKL